MTQHLYFLGNESYNEIQRRVPDMRSLGRVGHLNYWIALDGRVMHFPSGEFFTPDIHGGLYLWTPDRHNRVHHTVDTLVAAAWCTDVPDVWQHSKYADRIREAREYFQLHPQDKVRMMRADGTASSFWLSRYGDIWDGRTFRKRPSTVPNDQGYRHVTIGNRRNVTVHRLVAENFVPIPSVLRIRGFTKDNLVVNHKDGNKLNNRWDNLEWCTLQQNNDHARRHGLLKNTISNELLDLAFRLLSQGKTDAEISEITRIPAPTVSNIRRRVTKRYDTPDYAWPMYSVSKEKMRERHCEVIDLYNQGLTYAEISKRLGTAQTHITTILNTYPELVTRQRRDNTAQNNGERLDEAKLTRIFEALASGKSNLEIGQECGIDPAKVANIRARRIYAKQGMKYDWPMTKPINSKTRAETDKEYREIIDLLNQGASWKSICEKYDCDSSRISAARQRYGYLLNQRKTTHDK